MVASSFHLDVGVFPPQISSCGTPRFSCPWVQPLSGSICAQSPPQNPDHFLPHSLHAHPMHVLKYTLFPVVGKTLSLNQSAGVGLKNDSIYRVLVFVFAPNGSCQLRPINQVFSPRSPPLRTSISGSEGTILQTLQTYFSEKPAIIDAPIHGYLSPFVYSIHVTL